MRNTDSALCTMMFAMDHPEEIVEPETAEAVEMSIPLARKIDPSAPWPALPPPAHPILLSAQPRRQSILDIAVFVVLFLAFALTGEMIIGLIYREIYSLDFPNDDELNSAIARMALFPAIIWRTIVATALILWLTRRQNLPLQSVGLTRGGFAINLLLGIAAFFAIAIGVIVCTTLVQMLFPRLAQEFEKNADMIMDAVPRVRPPIFFVICLFIGFYEELIFRGFLMPRLRRATNSWLLAVLLSTTVFAALHLKDQAAAASIPIVSLSLTFSVLTIWRRSLVPAMLAHALFDFAMFLTLYYSAGPQWK